MGELENAESVNGGSLRDVCRCDSMRAEARCEDSEQSSDLLPAVPDDAETTLSPETREFDHKVERVVSGVMVIACFVLNWYSAFEGKPQYIPDWAVGIACGGFMMRPYTQIKGWMKRNGISL